MRPSRDLRLLRPVRRRLGLAAGVALLLLARGAAAAGPTVPGAAPTAKGPAAPNPADKRAAQKLLAQGNQLLGEGDYVGALEKFRTAYDKFPSPKLLLNIGTTLRQLGRNVEAAEVYERYLRDPEHDAGREKEVQRVLREIDALVGRLIITVDDASARVRLDGKALEGFVSGESRRVDLGEHTVIADKDGSPPVVQTVEVQPMKEYHLALMFAPPPPKPQASTQRLVALAFGGVGALGLVVGAAAGVAASVQNGDAAGHCYQGGNHCDAKGVDLGRAAKTSAAVSTAGFIVGLGFLGTGALLYLLAPAGSTPRLPIGLGPERGGTAALSPWISFSPLPSGAAVSFGGAF